MTQVKNSYGARLYNWTLQVENAKTSLSRSSEHKMGKSRVTAKKAFTDLQMLACNYGCYMKLGNEQRDISKEFISKMQFFINLIEDHPNVYAFENYRFIAGFLKDKLKTELNWQRIKKDKDRSLRFTFKQMQCINKNYRALTKLREVLDENKQKKEAADVV